MRTSFKSVVAGVVTLIVAGAIATVGATSAFAAGPFDPTADLSDYGTVTFFNAAGQVVTSGDATNPLSAQYAVASTTPPNVVTPRTTIALFQPQPGVNPGNWGGVTLNGTTLYPLTGAGVPAIVSSSPNPQGAMLATSNNFAAAALNFIVNPAPFDNVYQVRLINVLINVYAAATIHIDPVTKIWTQIDPAPKTATTTSLAVSPASPANAPANVTLTATVATGPPATPAAAGSVQFFNGATSLGTSPVVAGVATLPLPGVAAGTFSYTATFTPTDTVTFASSTSSAVPFVVQVPKPTPAVALTSTLATPTFGSPVTFQATVGQAGTPPVTVPGTVQFFDGTTSLAPAAAANAAGVATLTTSALIIGVHPVTATFVPTDLVTFNGSTSPAVTVNVLAVAPASCSLPGSVCTDAQAFTASVPAGSIVISTPYHANNPFNLGTMALNAAGTQYTTSNAFGSAANPAEGVTITDTRAGGLGWTASLQSGAFTNNTVLPVGVINAGNLGFTGVAPQYIGSGNALSATGNVVLPFDNAASTPVLGSSAVAPALSLANPQKFASAAIGAGSVNVTGLFTLNAPSSVPAGLYAGTVTFTIA